MKVIMEVITWGVTTLPPLKKSHPEIYERRGSTRNDEGCIDCVVRRTTGELKGGSFSVTAATFPFMRG
jgi:hypothetical protein